MSEYRLTSAAEKDLIAIVEYSDKNFGIRQSDLYREQLKAHFTALAEHPLYYPSVEHIKKGYRRTVCGRHSIYYRVDSLGVVIVRILRGQNLQNALG